MDSPIYARDEHECRGQCEMPGICEVKAEPRKVITKYTGKLETFHFTMVGVKLIYKDGLTSSSTHRRLES